MIRLDNLLVTDGYFESRERAKQAILAGLVYVNGQLARKAAQQIQADARIEVLADPLPYVSRGGLKLEKAINTFSINLQGKIVLDVGASTGGFTDCALQFGARHVFTVDVGSKQLVKSLRKHPQVTAYENKHIKDLSLKDINNQKLDTIVCDLSFISLSNILSYFPPLIKKDGEIILLIKPQFEVGPAHVEKNGIVKNPDQHRWAIGKVIDHALIQGFYCHALTFSPIVNPRKNIEYLALFKTERNTELVSPQSVVEEAFAEKNNFSK